MPYVAIGESMGIFGTEILAAQDTPMEIIPIGNGFRVGQQLMGLDSRFHVQTQSLFHDPGVSRIEKPGNSLAVTYHDAIFGVFEQRDQLRMRLSIPFFTFTQCFLCPVAHGDSDIDAEQ
jgi:hypothetical protein